ncbi:organic solvent tolerance protein OstA [Nostocales cyanobacterium HT-58-2]|nr:organic solvent tolerance protein OstA [Nostocales cyanobacterium HT-58-2]
MLHPVLPPEPPPNLESLKSANPVSVVTTDTKALGKKEKSEAQRETPSLQTAGQKPTDNHLLVAQTLAAPSAPETFPPEFSPITASKSSASLGQQLSVGYPRQQQPQASHPSNGGTTAAPSETFLLKEPVAQTVTALERLSQKQTQPVVKKSAQTPNQGKPTTEKSGSDQPVDIEFKIRGQTTEESTPAPNTQNQSAPTPQLNTTKQQSQPSGTTAPSKVPSNMPPARERIVEVTSDRQEYDEQRRVVTAEGNVIVRFDGAIVDADRLQVSLDNLIAVGEGNVALTRGDQVLRGQRFTYNLVQDSGELINGTGEIFVPTAGQDLSFLPTDVTTGGVPKQPLSDRIRENQPLQASSPGGLNINLGGSRGASNLPVPKQGGQVRRIRFEAGRIDFYPRGYQARNVRLTNDPFSPPELEVRADKVTVTRETPLRDRIKTERQRLVFDQRFSVPIPRDEQVIDRSKREVTPGLFSIGYDGDQRGGVFVERSFKVINTEQASFSLTPQFYPQKAVQNNAGNVPSLFGLKSRLNATLSPRTRVEGSGLLTSLDLGDIEDNLRASLRLRQLLGEQNPHTLTLEYSYRDRLYNGTLGFQTVQSSLGGIVTSPVIPLGKSGINLSYQAGAQYINANTDRPDLLEPNRKNDRISLSRLQASAALNGGTFLWQGKPLPATATEGLRYTANPVVPFVRLFGGVTGTTSYYSSGDSQNTLIGTVGLEGQFGHFSRPFFDYTGFRIEYSQGLNTGLSPFLFDRAVDNRVLTAGITQQIYGPLRAGFQTSINLDTGERSSTDYVVEYSRRTYGITLRYNPVLELGGISFRISDFNWSGGTDPFSDPSEVKPVVGGVRQD